MYGGAISENDEIEDPNQISIYANYDKNAPSIGEQQLLHGNIIVDRNDKHMTRVSNFIYSGDLIQLTTPAKGILTYYANDLYQVKMANNQEITPAENQLSKLRLVRINANPLERTLSPIRYGDDLFIEFNVVNQPELVKWHHNQAINIKDTQGSDIFKLVNAQNQNSNEVVHSGDEILIIKSVNSQIKDIYLYVDKDFSIKTNGNPNQASHFIINTAIGCGPNWRYDQDTRNLKGQYFTQSDIDELISDSTGVLMTKLQTAKNELNQMKQDCENKLNKEKNMNSSLKNV